MAPKRDLAINRSHLLQGTRETLISENKDVVKMLA